MTPFLAHAHGKLLLTGEYFVLDGAQALALPVRYGQTLRAETWKEPNRLSWTSKNCDGSVWFLAEFELPECTILQATDRKTADTLQQMLLACRRRNLDFLAADSGYKVLTQNDFPRNWGLGTSSTLIAALARWAAVDPYEVLAETLGGSGYDLACAFAAGPVLYQLVASRPVVQPVDFAPPFSQQLWLVFLNKKQDSRAGIRRYRECLLEKSALAADISALTAECLAATTLEGFEDILRRHERLVGAALELPLVQERCFADFWGVVKSLGAWGGDFVLATSAQGEEVTRGYFQERGFEVVIPWREMVM